MPEQLRICSFGGGVQSTALLVLAAQGEIDFRAFLFCNVGEDSENPATLVYVRDVALPFAMAHGLMIHTLKKVWRDGRDQTLLGHIMASTRSIRLPMRMPDDLGFMRRNCTPDFKVRVIETWCRGHGATKNNRAITAIGISLDEAHRANSRHESPLQQKVYPLLDLHLNRDDCRAIIRNAGLPVPPKSSCWFCPYHSNAVWQEMREQEPVQFARAVALEERLSGQSLRLQGRPCYLHNRLKPLPQATTEAKQLRLFDDRLVDVRESGFCMT